MSMLGELHSAMAIGITTIDTSWNLNSRLMAWFFPNISATFRGGYWSANRQFLSQLPFVTIDARKQEMIKLHDDLVGLTEKMIGLLKGATQQPCPRRRRFRTDKSGQPSRKLMNV